MPQTLQSVFPLKNSFNSKVQLSNRNQTKIGKVLKKFNSLFRYVTVRASNALMQGQRWK